MTDFRHAQAVTTIDSREVAEALARGAVQARLAACAQVSGPIRSTYRWEGAVETAEEWQITLKTTTDRYPALAEYLRAHHGYETPEIILLPILAGDPAYLAWITTETAG
ncbi:divalent-cation tolerance protein CutA [Actinoplanes sp. NPDC051851]|uniref:divalent-cation tolerance protein CutA n=1 Tax=Actinoplanes sp. NPDC051851 TaxID=3154753 RepID=UPI00342A2FB1